MKKLFLIIFTVLFFICPVFAENFYIENYDVKIDVDKNKSALIQEDIFVYFTKSSHGIYRDIPYKNASITDVSVSEHYTKTYENGSLNLKIGNPTYYVNGKMHYVIKYRYNYFDNKNEFYHNIIGTDWKVPINNVNFSITMPKEINPSDVGLSIGSYGTRGFDGGAYYSVNNRSITGQTQRTLSPGEGITVRVRVPAGYFNKTHNIAMIIVISLIILLTLVPFLIWYIYGKDEPVTPVVNFYPPIGLNAMETELAYKGKASNKGLIGLLIELAHKGYIKIEDNGHQWVLYKLKILYDDLKKEEKDLINTIFKYCTNSVSQSDLTYSKTFYRDCANIIEDVNKRSNLIFYKESKSYLKKFRIFICSTGLLFLTVFALSGYNIFFIIKNFPLFLFPTIALIVLISTFSRGKVDACSTIFIIVWASGLGGIPLLILSGTSLANSQTLPVGLLGIAGLAVSCICLYQLPKRNPAGQQLLNDILGLKHFIEVAEKSRLKSMVEQNPEYFYNVLPSAYVLEVSDKWISKFQSIMELAPDWYSGTPFNSSTFNNFTDTAQSASAPSVANGGISTSSGGGGGFSGGGGGGGGGGSW